MRKTFFVYFWAILFSTNISAQEVRTKIDFKEKKSKSTTSQPVSEIIVEARKRPENRQNIPISTKVFSPSLLKESQARDFSDVFGLLPSANYSTVTDNHGTANFSMRGVSSAVISSAVHQPTAFYFDEVYIGNSIGMNLDLLDVKQIEVLKGPQGTLYGKNAFAGAVNVFTENPKNKKESSVQLTAGNLNLYKLEATTNAPILKDKLFARVAVSVLNRDGYITNTVDSDKLKNQDTISARTKLRYVPSSKTDVIFSADYTRDRPTGVAVGDFDSLLDSSSVSIRDPYEEFRDVLGTSLKIVNKQKNFNITSITGVRGFDFGAEGSDFVAANNFQQGQFNKQIQGSQEIRLSTRGKRRTHWTAGTLAYAEKHEANGHLQFFDFANFFTGINSGDTDFSQSETNTQSYAVFGDVTHSLNSKLDLSGGLRYTHETISMDYAYFSSGTTTGFAPAQTFSGTSHYNNISPKFSAIYKVTPQFRTYSTISRGYKGGGFNNYVVASDQFEFKEEKAWNYEVGVKSEFLNKRLKTNLAVFYFDWEDMQIESYAETFGRVTSNASDAYSTGIDFEIAATITSRASLIGEYSYARSRFRDYTDFPTPTQTNSAATTDVTGNVIPYASEHSFAIGGRYAHPVSSTMKLTTSVSHNYKGNFYFDSLNTLEQPGYGLYNASIALIEKTWSFALWGKNITDVKYRTLGIDLGARGKKASLGEPVTFGATFKKVF